MNPVHFEDPYGHINPMYNENNSNRLVDAYEEHIREYSEEEGIIDDVNYNTIYEEELENIHPDLDYNFPSPTMNKVLMNIHHNDPDNFIDKPEYFRQYLR